MTNQSFYVALLGFAIVNGIFSPAVAFAFLLHPLWYPPIAPFYLPVVFLLSSLLVATATLMIAGVPAAIFEHVSGQRKDNKASAWIWLAGTALLSTPAVTRAFGVL
ncbi:hypothetical protein [Chthonobacter rhizosphaerae]|uniref:hypothetical protein n=1 Tax=Chthonobacter rhizosphaerae TaxID=2735553 RepID=UPI0015EEC865|nr:hypothetical protein [Chthonobacter rhizosphaerae]